MEADRELGVYELGDSSDFCKRRCQFCSFGLGEAAVGLIAGGLGDIGLGTVAGGSAGLLGAGATTDVASGLLGAGVGAGSSALTGGNPLTGALTGGLTLGLGSAFGGELASTLGIGTQDADALIGAASGALGAGVTGGNVLTTALSGGALGYSEAPSGGGSPVPATGSGGAANSAIASALPGGSGVNVTTDLTGATVPNASGVSVNPLQPTGVPGISGTGGGGAVGGASASALPGFSQVPVGPITPNLNTAALGNINPIAGATSGSSIGGGILDSLGKNPIGDLTTAAGIYQGQVEQSALNKDVGDVKKQVRGLNQQSGTLESYLNTGQLPPGAQAAVSQATAAAKAAIQQKYANLGLSGSTMEAVDLANVDQQAAAQQFQIADSLYKQGQTSTGLADDLYSAILNAQGDTVRQTNAAVTNYAAALGGGNYAPKPSGG